MAVCLMVLSYVWPGYGFQALIEGPPSPLTMIMRCLHHRPGYHADAAPAQVLLLNYGTLSLIPSLPA